MLHCIDRLSFDNCVHALQAYDHKINQQVALKIIRNKKRFHHQALVEVKLLDSLRKKVFSNTCTVVHVHVCI